MAHRTWGSVPHIALCNSLFWQEVPRTVTAAPQAPLPTARRRADIRTARRGDRASLCECSGRADTIALQRAYDPSTEVAPARKSLRHATDCDIATDRIDQDRSVKHLCCDEQVERARLTARLAIP